jgi:hypothetical protein
MGYEADVSIRLLARAGTRQGRAVTCRRVLASVWTREVPERAHLRVLTADNKRHVTDVEEALCRPARRAAQGLFCLRGQNF